MKTIKLHIKHFTPFNYLIQLFNIYSKQYNFLITDDNPQFIIETFNKKSIAIIFSESTFEIQETEFIVIENNQINKFEKQTYNLKTETLLSSIFNQTKIINKNDYLCLTNCYPHFNLDCFIELNKFIKIIQNLELEDYFALVDNSLLTDLKYLELCKTTAFELIKKI